MPVSSKTYRIDYKDEQEQLFMIKIHDMKYTWESGPFEFVFSIVNNGNGTQTVTFTYLPIPFGVNSALYIGYSAPDANAWTDVEVAFASPQSIVIPVGDYDLRVVYYFEVPGDPEIWLFPLAGSIKLDAADDAYEQSVVNNDEDKFSPIRAQQAVIRFISNSNYNLNLFLGDDVYDDRFYVTVEVNEPGRYVFKGFITLDDIEELFLSGRNVVQLVATDKLGSIKEKALVKPDGSNPTGDNRIIDYITWALAGTGMNLPVNVVWNIKDDKSFYRNNVEFRTVGPGIQLAAPDPFFIVGHTIRITGSVNNDGDYTITGFAGGGFFVVLTGALINEFADVTIVDITGGDHFFNRIFLDAKTFEKEIGSSVDGYKAISIIISNYASLTQEKGEWWIKSVDDFDNIAKYNNKYDENGAFVSETIIVHEKTIKENLPVWFSQRGTRVGGSRPIKFAKLTYKFETPKELPCNPDFVRGELIATISDTDKHYAVECWTMKRGTPAVPGVPGNSAYIRRLFNTDGYETDRYVVITPEARVSWSSTDFTYLESEGIEMDVKDKFTVSCDFKLPNTITGFSDYYPLLRCIMKGDDGSYWILGNEDFFPDEFGQTDFKWYNTGNWTINTAAGLQPLNFTATSDEREWRTISWESPELPIGGKLYLWLHEFNSTNQAADNIDIHYGPISFSYKPRINGTYVKYQSQYNKVTQAGGYNSNVDEEVFMSDSPKRIFKGAMKRYNGVDYVLAGKFYNSAVHYQNPPVADDQYELFSRRQVFAVFNQYKRIMRRVRFQAQGIDAAALDAQGLVDLPGLLHKYTLGDNSQHTTNKIFMLMSFNQKRRTGNWNGVVKEVFDTDKGKVYTDDFEFKYVE